MRYHGLMIFANHPTPLADNVPLPALRQKNIWLPLLDEITQLVSDRKDQFLNASSSPEDWETYRRAFTDVSVLSPQKAKWGQFFAAALVNENSEAAESILIAVDSKNTNHAGFMLEMMVMLHESGRLDLFRPALCLIHDFFQNLWKNDASARAQCSLPPSWNSLDIPKLSSISQYELQKGLAEHEKISLRAAKSWWDLGNQLPELIRCRENDEEPEFDLSFLALSKALETMPSLCQFAAPCLVSLGDILTQSSMSIRQETQRHFIHPNEPHYISLEIRAQYLGKQSSSPNKKDNNLMVARVAFLERHKKDMIEVTRVVIGYDQVTSWLGPSHGDELSPDSAAALELLLSYCPKSWVPVLRATVDKALLTHVSPLLFQFKTQPSKIQLFPRPFAGVVDGFCKNLWPLDVCKV